MIRGAIFDLDGTLLDSMSIWDTLGEDYLASLGLKAKENLKETFETFTMEQAARYYQDHYGVTLRVSEIVDGLHQMIENYYTACVQLKPGVAEFLQKLRERGVKMCVATVTEAHLAEAALSRLGIIGHFQGIFTCSQVGYGKESPQIYREALGKLQTKKDETMVFEDALYALQTAKADGFLTAAVEDSHESQQEALRALADCYLTDYFHTEPFWYVSGLEKNFHWKSFQSL